MATIRRYMHADWEAFLALEIQTSLDTAQITAPHDVLAFKARWPDVLRNTYRWDENGPSADKHAVWVLTEGDAHVGQLWLTKQDDFFTLKPKLFITALAVTAAARGRGYGALLLAHAREQAMMAGCVELGLAVSAANEGAVRLYEKFGFKTARLSYALAITHPQATMESLHG